MRIPLIQSIRPKHAFFAAIVLVFLQQLEGTNLPFSVLCGAYVLLSVFAFNAAGGLTYPSGTFIFSTSLLTALIGIFFKVFLVEPGDSNLSAPVVTMATYCGSMTVMWAAAAIVHRIVPRKGLLPKFESDDLMKKAAMGALFVGVIITVLSAGGGQEEGSFATAVRQINFFVPISIVLATYYQVRRTNGRESTNWIVWSGIIFIFTLGLIGFSKQGLISPWVSWLVAAMASGYNFSKQRLVFMLVGVIFFETYLLPFTEYGRNFRSEDQSVLADAKTAFGMLQDLGGTRASYIATASDPENSSGDRPHFYNQSHGLLDRLVMLPPDDALTAYTDQGNIAGLLPTFGALINLVPHFLWKNKPISFVGNQYGRELGIISSEDEGTGISFSPTADAYHQEGWYGIFLLLPVVFFLLFLILDGLGGSLRESPWAMFLAVGCSHTAPEGAVGGQIYFATYGSLGLIIVALLSKYVFSVLAGVITNSERSQVKISTLFKPTLRPRLPGPLTPPK